jgi:hypothetical protein
MYRLISTGRRPASDSTGTGTVLTLFKDSIISSNTGFSENLVKAFMLATAFIYYIYLNGKEQIKLVTVRLKSGGPVG